jgi:hypothetical protein
MTAAVFCVIICVTKLAPTGTNPPRAYLFLYFIPKIRIAPSIKIAPHNALFWRLVNQVSFAKRPILGKQAREARQKFFKRHFFIWGKQSRLISL